MKRFLWLLLGGLATGFLVADGYYSGAVCAGVVTLIESVWARMEGRNR